MSSMEIGSPSVLTYLTSRRMLSDIAGKVSFMSWIRVIISAFRAPLPRFLIETVPDFGEVASSFSNTALADFTAGCCLPFHFHAKSRVPDNFSARRPIAMRAKAVDWVLNQFSSARF